LGDTIPSTLTRGAIADTGNDEATTDALAPFSPGAPYSPVDVRAVIAGRMGVAASSVIDPLDLAAPGMSDTDVPAVLNAHILR
jgi:hypothetical protein